MGDRSDEPFSAQSVLCEVFLKLRVSSRAVRRLALDGHSNLGIQTHDIDLIVCAAPAPLV